MNKVVDVARFLLRLNMRVECLKVTKDKGWPVTRSAEGISVPEDPCRYTRDFMRGAGLSDFIAQDYAAMKPEVDEKYTKLARVMNAQIGRLVRVEKIGRLNTDLSKLWGERVGLKVYTSSLIFPEGPVNIHVSHAGKYEVRVNGYSLNEGY